MRGGEVCCGYITPESARFCFGGGRGFAGGTGLLDVGGGTGLLDVGGGTGLLDVGVGTGFLAFGGEGESLGGTGGNVALLTGVLRGGSWLFVRVLEAELF